MIIYNIIRSLIFTAAVSIALLIVLSLGAAGFVIFVTIALFTFVFNLTKGFKKYKIKNEEED